MFELYKNDDIKSITITKDYFMINWHMTGWCNYHCPFCIAAKMQTKWIPEDVMIEYAKNLNLFINKNLSHKQTEFKLIGGEVTFFNLERILDEIEHINKIVLVTNLSRPLEYFYSFEHYCKKRDIQLVLICSLHDENKEFEEKFLTLTEWCRQQRLVYKYRYYKDPPLTLVVSPEFDTSLVDHYRDLGIWRIRLTRVRAQTQQNEDLPEDILNYVYNYNQFYEEQAGLKGQTYKITTLDGKETNFICASNFTNYLDKNGFVPDNFYCTAGTTSLALLPNGNVTLSRCDYLLDKSLGNIKDWDKITLPKSPVLCKLNSNTNGEKRCDLCAGTNLYRSNNCLED